MQNQKKLVQISVLHHRALKEFSATQNQQLGRIVENALENVQAYNVILARLKLE